MAIRSSVLIGKSGRYSTGGMVQLTMCPLMMSNQSAACWYCCSGHGPPRCSVVARNAALLEYGCHVVVARGRIRTGGGRRYRAHERGCVGGGVNRRGRRCRALLTSARRRGDDRAHDRTQGDAAATKHRKNVAENLRDQRCIPRIRQHDALSMRLPLDRDRRRECMGDSVSTRREAMHRTLASLIPCMDGRRCDSVRAGSHAGLRARAVT